MTHRSILKNSAIVVVLLSFAIVSSGCFPKRIMADDTNHAPTPKQITDRLYNGTIGKLLDQPVTADDIWLLPTPTPVPSGLFDQVFGKAREIIPTVVVMPGKRNELWATVTVSALNVRDNPTADANVIEGLIKDQQVRVLAQDGDWLQISLDDGRTGWSSAQFMLVEERVPATPTPKPTTAALLLKAKAKVLAGTLNVRSQPDTNGTIVGSLMQNQCVDLIGGQNGWYLVGMSGGVTGWCAGEYMQAVDSCSAPLQHSSADSSSGSTGSVQPVAYQEPAPTVATGPPPMKTNAMIVAEGYMHECWGGGWDEVRFVSSNTPIEVLGSGPWTPPADQQAKIGPGPYVKIRIWDGQYGWISENSVNVKAAYVNEVSGECLENERIDWGAIVRPTPLPTQRPTPIPRNTASTTNSYTVPRYPTATPAPTLGPHKYRDE